MNVWKDSLVLGLVLAPSSCWIILSIYLSDVERKIFGIDVISKGRFISHMYRRHCGLLYQTITGLLSIIWLPTVLYPSLVQFLAAWEVVAQLANFLTLWSRYNQYFMHIEIWNLSIIGCFITVCHFNRQWCHFHRQFVISTDNSLYPKSRVKLNLSFPQTIPLPTSTN